MRIAVVTAFNPKNAGMFSVDLAAEEFFRNRKCEVVFFRMHTKKQQANASFGGQEFRLVRSPSDFDPFDVIVYWGDFINNPAYGKKEFFGWDLKYGLLTDRHQSFEKWKQFCLLKGVKKIHQKVISVSNNFQEIDATLRKFAPTEVSEISALFEENFDAIFPRDPVSTEILLKSIPYAAKGNVYTGLDAAFLLDIKKLPTLGCAIIPKFSYLFARSNIQGINGLICSAAFHNRSIPLALRKWHSLNSDAKGRLQYFSMMDEIQKSSFVLTDVYHVCINAMNLGVPVVGLGNAASHQIDTIGDFKKKVLFSMFGLEGSYFEVPETTLDRGDIDDINSMIALQVNASKSGIDYANLHQKKIEYRARLEASIFGS